MTFEVAEGIQQILADGEQKLPDLGEFSLNDVSPALELLYNFESERIQFDILSRLHKTSSVNDLLAASNVGISEHFRSIDRRIGLMSVSLASKNLDSWRDFQLAFERSSRKAGFSKLHVGKMLATLIEFYDNVLMHSQKIETGQVIFIAHSQRVEVMVRDQGIGVLESLCQNPNIAGTIDNYGSAIERALKSNVSRFYLKDHVGRGHGFGFDELIRGLANCSEYIRFRSGDYCRECIRDTNNRLFWQTRQLSFVKGFSCNVIFTPSAV